MKVCKVRKPANVSIDELTRRCAQGTVEVIDVRTPVEYRATHAAGARNVPLDSLDPHEVMQGRNGRTAPLYVICQGGTRGAAACRKFFDAGYSNVVNVEGGTTAWVAAGLPVVRGKRSISLERQVRIAAGSLVLIGAALGFFVHPYFNGLSALVGGGLLFAGITDTCGMAMLLARMPWNQCSHQEPQ
jgi:rhodanese-related sulfurtransferase